MTTNTQQDVHPFEAAGLGTAPFNFIRYEYFVGNRAFVAYATGGTVFANSSHSVTGCDLCGTAIKNQYFVGDSTGRVFKLGSECIRKLDQRMYKASRELRNAALRSVRDADRQAAARKRTEAERAAREAEQTAWIEANPWWTALLNHERAKLDTTIQSLAASFARYGTLTENQQKLAQNTLERWQRPAAEVPLCSSRTTVRGIVLAVKEDDRSFYPSMKALIEVTAPNGGTYKLWGSRPTVRGSGFGPYNKANIVEKGDTVEFDAVITRSDRDPSFGFFSRATKVRIVSKLNPPGVA